MNSRPSINLHDVAKKAGVSAMTVSRVLNNSPHVSPATRRSVLRTVKALKYQPDPQIARLMRVVRGRKEQHISAVMAVIRDDIHEDELHDPAYQFVSIHDIRRRAEQHGYNAEEFWLGRGELTPARLGDILLARGIEGFIISPQSSKNIGTQLDYAPFASATFGYGLSHPALHRASTNMMQGILRATAELTKRGYRRIGLAVTRWIDDRADHSYCGAMLHYQQGIPRAQRVPLMLFPNNDLEHCEEIFCRWMKAQRPDALISFDRYVPDWLAKRLGLRVPHDIGLVVHDWADCMEGLAGIYHRRPHVADAAVDIVAGQLARNERGIPDIPRQVLIPPEWINGASVVEGK